MGREVFPVAKKNIAPPILVEELAAIILARPVLEAV